jgi:hypothetical protein
MKKLLLVLALGVVVASCKKEDLAPNEAPCECKRVYLREILVHHTELPTMPYIWDTSYISQPILGPCKDTFAVRFIINNEWQQIRERKFCID